MSGSEQSEEEFLYVCVQELLLLESVRTRTRLFFFNVILFCKYKKKSKKNNQKSRLRTKNRSPGGVSFVKSA